MSVLGTLKSEIDTDPLTRGYAGMTDQQVADDLNLLIYDDVADQAALRDYLLTNEHRGESLYGRLLYVAQSRVGDLAPMDDAESGIVMTINHIAGANALLAYADPNLPPVTPLTNAGFDGALNAVAGGAQNAQVMGPGHKTAIQALSQNKKSRAQVLGLGVVRAGTVGQARSL